MLWQRVHNALDNVLQGPVGHVLQTRPMRQQHTKRAYVVGQYHLHTLLVRHVHAVLARVVEGEERLVP